MWSMLSLTLFLLTCSAIMPASWGRSDEEIRREYVAKYQRAINQSIAAGAEPVTVEKYVGPPKSFTCDTTKPEWYIPATDVHLLTPWDVSIIGAMGDSVTAAFGADASTIFDVFFEYRRFSWSIGGDKTIHEVSTLPNIIKMYNPDLRGYSEWLNQDKLNMAETGARAEAMIGQAQRLVETMKIDYGDVDDDWKVITLWIGGNDLCDTCDGDPEKHADEYSKKVEASLIYLSQHVKKAFVNLVDMIDVTQLMQLRGLWCDIVHGAVCNCATREDNQWLLQETVRQYNIYLKKMLERNDYFDRSDFTVVIQPFFSDTLLPKKEDGTGDSSYFSPDCFHFSTKGHGVGALYLWNNMLEKVGEKTDYIDWDDMQDYKCISDEYRYFSTDKLSQGLRSRSNGNLDTSETHLVPGLVGGACGILVVVVTAIVIIVILFKRKKTSFKNGEKINLITEV